MDTHKWNALKAWLNQWAGEDWRTIHYDPTTGTYHVREEHTPELRHMPYCGTIQEARYFVELFEDWMRD